MPLPLIVLAIVIIGFVRFLSSREQKRSAPRSVARRARPEPDPSPGRHHSWDAPKPTQRRSSREERQRRARGLGGSTQWPAPAGQTLAPRPDALDLRRRLPNSVRERQPTPQPGPAPVTPRPTQAASRRTQATPLAGDTTTPAVSAGQTAAPGAGMRPAYPGDLEGPLPADRIGSTRDITTGDVIIAWVPSREDPSRGETDPVLVVGREPGWLLAVQVTLDVEPGAADRIDIGIGEWDGATGEAQALTDRVIRVHEESSRKTGARVSRSRMLAVGRALRRR